MKPYKLLAAMFLVFSCIAFTGCDDDDEYYYYDQLPDAANAFLNSFFYNDEVDDIDVEGYGTATTYEVEMMSGTEIYFDYYGNWYYIEAPWGYSIPSGIVPYPIESYVYDYYGAGINTVYIRNWGYRVTTTDNVTINFGPDGYPL